MQYAIFVIMLFTLFNTLGSPKKREVFKKRLSRFKALRISHFLKAWATILGVMAVTATLYVLFPPLRWGWWTALGNGGTSVIPTSASASPSTFELVMPVLMCIMVMLFLASWAYEEEDVFRRGAEDRTGLQKFIVAFLFGMMHVVVGVPLAAGIGLTLGGLVFTRAYLRGFHAAHLANAGSAYLDVLTREEGRRKTQSWMFKDMNTGHLPKDTITLTKERARTAAVDASEAGVKEATSLHLAYNLTIVTIVSISVAAVLL